MGFPLSKGATLPPILRIVKVNSGVLYSQDLKLVFISLSSVFIKATPKMENQPMLELADLCFGLPILFSCSWEKIKEEHFFTSSLLFICLLFHILLSLPCLCSKSWHQLLGRRIQDTDNRHSKLKRTKTLLSANIWRATTASYIGRKRSMIIINQYLSNAKNSIDNNRAPTCLTLLCIC